MKKINIKKIRKFVTCLAIVTNLFFCVANVYAAGDPLAVINNFALVNNG